MTKGQMTFKVPCAMQKESAKQEAEGSDLQRPHKNQVMTLPDSVELQRKLERVGEKKKRKKRMMTNDLYELKSHFPHVRFS